MSAAVETMEFESGRLLNSLFANDNRLLREAGDQLEVKFTVRDGWLRIEGESGAVERAGRVFTQLESLSREGVGIAASHFRQAVRSVVEVGQDELPVLERAGAQLGRGRRITPRNRAQHRYLESIRRQDIVFGVGPAGTGKTYLAMAMAVEALREGKVGRLVLTRPAVEAGEALGFLPGDLNEKIFPYLRPLYDALYDMMPAGEIGKYLETGVVEIAPLAYMRGRTLNHAFVILDEAQNTTAEQMFMFLTRLGADSQCVVTGDRTQIDLPPSKKSGLVEALGILDNILGIGIVEFTESDVIRHELVQQIISAYRQKREAEPSGHADKADGTG